MNIKHIQAIAKIYGEQAKVTRTSKNKNGISAQQPDEVILSSKAQELSKALQTIKALPEVRADKVKELSERIAAGEYKVDSRELADRIIAYSKNTQ